MPLFTFLIGLAVGSFLNVLADRLPRGESVLWGRSHCDHCKKTLRWFELIPVLSYIIQRGKCVRCRKPLSVQYPLVELATGVGCMLLYLQFNYLPAGEAGPLALLLTYLLIYCSLLVLFVCDLKYQILPDSMIVAGLVAALASLLLSPAPLSQLPPRLIAAAGSFAFLYLLWAGTRGRGMGFGDVKLAFLMGLLLGYPGVVVAFYTAFLTGAFAGVILMIAGKKKWKSKIAFGPFLIFGTIVAFVWGVRILEWWSILL